MDIAKLAIEVDASQATAAAQKLQSFKKTAEAVETTAAGMGKSVNATVPTVSTLGKAAKATSVDVGRLTSAIDSVGAELSTNQLSGATAQIDALSGAAKAAETSTSAVAVASDAAGKAAGNSAYKYRMAAMQLSQVASQGAVTGNYIQALAIQLPDLALGFGTLGIVAGALAGALAGPLINALTATDKEAEKLDDQINELIGSLASSERQANQTLLARLQSQAAEASAEIGNLEKATRGLSGRQLLAATTGDRRRLEDIAKITEEIAEIESKSVGTAGRQRLTLTNRRRQLESELAALTSVDAERTEKIAEIEQRRQKILEAIEVVQGRINEGVKTRYENEMTMIDKNAFSLQDYLDEQLMLDASRVQSRANALKAIESLEAAQMTQQEKLTDNYLTQQYAISSALAGEFESIESRLMAGAIATQTAEDMKVAAVEEANALKLASDQEYEEKRRLLALQSQQMQMQMNATTLSSAQSLNSNLIAALEAYGQESSDLGLAAIAVQKGLMVAQAIMSANMAAIQTQVAYAGLAAATANPALAEVGIARGEIVRGMGYASAALIAATEFAPARAFGGQVQAGTSYLVGERGPELVTMGANGYVTPNDKLGGKSSPVINVIEDASKAGTQEVQQMGEQDIINIFVSNIQRGGAAARAMQGAYGLRRAAR